ncbi:MAG: phosphate/phosphite/phosphonate ABC transporter substrate-binding protein [Chloroflexi bacterium]|nr:phosphate/phosphite/phosphonate ABC transporter substrate-binding protein [Chloroflexota bacterium]
MTKTSMRLIWALVLSLLVLSACGSIGGQPTLEFNPVTETPELVPPTPMPTYTPTPAPLGSPENPIVIGLIIQESVPGQAEALQSVLMHLSEGLSLTFTSQTFANYVDLELALQRGTIDMAWLTAPEYLLASQKNLVSSLLVTNHLGITAYRVQFLGHKDAELQSYYNPATNNSEATADQALAQLAGLRPCLTQEDSLSGYWVPLGYLSQNNISYPRPLLTYSFSASIRALYIKGICSYAVTYANSADPRTSSEVISDLTDVITKVPIIWISPPIIPNLSLSVSKQMELPLQNRISEYLRNFSREEIGKSLLSQMLDYEIAQLEPLHDSSFQPLRDLLATTIVRLADLAR